MSFKNKISSINTTQELVDFIKTIDCNVSFSNGRKFLYEKSGEKISYNLLVSHVYSKLQESKQIDGLSVAKELRELNLKAEKQLSMSPIIVRLTTYVKRIFNLFPREMILKEIEAIKITNSSAHKPESPEVSESVKKEQVAVIETLIQAKKNSTLFPREMFLGKDLPEVAAAKQNFKKIFEHKLNRALKLKGLSTCHHTASISRREDYHLELLLLKPKDKTQNKVKGEFSFIYSTPGKNDTFKSEKDFPNTLRFNIDLPLFSDPSEEISAEKIVENIDTAVDRFTSSLQALNLTLNDSLIPENDPNFFSPSNGVRFKSLIINTLFLNLESGQFHFYASLNLIDPKEKNVTLGISLVFDLSEPLAPNALAEAIKAKAVEEFDKEMRDRNTDPFAKLRGWMHNEIQTLDSPVIEEAINSLVNIMEMPDLKKHYDNKNKKAIEAILCKKNIHKTCLKIHPDKNPDKDDTKFKEFNTCLDQVQKWLKA